MSCLNCKYWSVEYLESRNTERSASSIGSRVEHCNHPIRTAEPVCLGSGVNCGGDKQSANCPYF